MTRHAADEGVSNWNVANILTVGRIIVAPFILWFLLADAGTNGLLRWVAAALFIVALATDGVDGAIARRYNLVTRMGKILDPIADKVVVSVALVGLSILGELPWSVTVLILIREIGITVWRLVELRRGTALPAGAGGKIKTAAQAVAISLALLPLSGLGPWVHVLDTITMSVAFVLTLLSGGAYVWDAWRTADEDDESREEGRARSTSETAASLVKTLNAEGISIAIAESLTGGLVAAELTRAPTASTCVRGGVVVYATGLKDDLLGVSGELLEEHGPVHPEVAIQMALRVREVCSLSGEPADVGVATTGVAGPAPQSGHEPGTVFVGIAYRERVHAFPLTLQGTRDEIRAETVRATLRIIRDELSGNGESTH